MYLTKQERQPKVVSAVEVGLDPVVALEVVLKAVPEEALDQVMPWWC